MKNFIKQQDIHNINSPNDVYIIQNRIYFIGYAQPQSLTKINGRSIKTLDNKHDICTSMNNN